MEHKLDAPTPSRSGLWGSAGSAAPAAAPEPEAPVQLQASGGAGGTDGPSSGAGPGGRPAIHPLGELYGDVPGPVVQARAEGAAPADAQPAVQLQAAASAAWQGGPTSQLKSASHTLADYLGWLRQAEAAYGEGREAFLQRLRRLYYSRFAGAAGGKFDQVIVTQKPDELPMTSPPVPLAALNGLYETGTIQVPSGAQVDVSHIFAGLDLAISHVSMKGEVGTDYYQVDPAGMLTWAGDLSSWFVEWHRQLKARQQQGAVSQEAQDELLLSLAANKVSKDDLLGDLDAQVMASEYTDTMLDPKMPDDYDGQFSNWEIPVLTDSVSGLLEAYYAGAQKDPAKAGKGKGGKGKGKGKAPEKKDPLEKRRFQRFLLSASPPIPFEVGDKKPYPIRLGDKAEEAVYQALSNTALLFINEGYAGDGADGVKTYAPVLRKIAAYFVKFLKAGLDKGDAPWPT